ncbi:MAG: hypothetical protein L0I79_06615 [Atopostipes sp.]|nr:hypothetical protein [Atopostipes sp.]
MSYSGQRHYVAMTN